MNKQINESDSHHTRLIIPAGFGFAVSLLALIIYRTNLPGVLIVTLAALCVLGTIFAYLDPDSWVFSAVAVCGGVAIGVGVNAFTDPTMEHNLFPIEIVMLTAIAAIPVFTGSLLGHLAVRFKRK